MKIKVLSGVFLLAALVLNCKKEDAACSRLTDGVYKYPVLPSGHSMSQDEVFSYLDIPDDIKSCISTEGLIKSCLTYPQLGLMYTSSSNLQVGYAGVVARFNGLRELESRGDAGEKLLLNYESVSPELISSFTALIDQGRFAANLRVLEMIIGQYPNLAKLSIQQKKALASRGRAVYLSKRANDYGISGMGTTAVLLGRLMKQNNYAPFLEYAAQSQSNWATAENDWSASLEASAKIYLLAEGYLNSLN